MLVEAAWPTAKAPGPLHAFFVRIRARRGHQIAAVAVARKLTVLCWHLLTKDEDYLWARPTLVANKTRAMELPAGHPQQKGSRMLLLWHPEPRQERTRLRCGTRQKLLQVKWRRMSEPAFHSPYGSFVLGASREVDPGFWTSGLGGADAVPF